MQAKPLASETIESKAAAFPLTVCQVLAVCTEKSWTPHQSTNSLKGWDKAKWILQHDRHFFLTPTTSLVLLLYCSNSQTKYHSCHFERPGFPVTGRWVSTLYFLSCFFISSSPSLWRGRTRHLKHLNRLVPQLHCHEEFLLWRCCTKISPPPQTSPLPAAEEGRRYEAEGLLSPPSLAMCEGKHISGFLRATGRGYLSAPTAGWDSKGQKCQLTKDPPWRRL